MTTASTLDRTVTYLVTQEYRFGMSQVKVHFSDEYDSWRLDMGHSSFNLTDEEADDLVFNELRNTSVEKIKKEDEETVGFTFGYISRHVGNWDGLCTEMGWNPWILNEGLATTEERVHLPVSVARKHGLIK